MRSLLTFLLVFGLFSTLFGQNNFWTPKTAESFALPEGAERRIQPTQSKTFQLDYSRIKVALSTAPMEFTPSAKQQPLILSLPLADGSIHTFKVWESPVMAPELMAKFPEIKTYAGKDAEGLGLTLRMGVGHKGLHAFIFSPNGRVQSVRPYAEDTRTFYMAYHQSDLPKEKDASGAHRTCGVGGIDDIDLSVATPLHNHQTSNRGEAENVTLRKYRLAVSAQAEYSIYHGGTKPSVMSAIVEAVNYIVAIQERDWAVRLELVPNNDTLIFFDPNTDPFSGPLIPNWIGDNPGAINPLIGINSYDIGHLFSKVANPTGVYVAGQAALSGVCTQVEKAVAGSSLPAPVGEDFYLIIAHEMGHQFSATHTFNNCPPAQDAQTGGTAYEPGGGSTIMSYSTTCDPEIIGETDPYFHVASLEQVFDFIIREGGSTCPTTIVTDNHFPEVSIPLQDNFFIPISTPFELTGVGSDMDGDDLTYTWEEFDLGPVTSLGQPVEDSPIFRSVPPDVSPSRTFPRINSIVANTSSNAEVLPTYGRNLTFKVTARDNYAGSGGVAIDEVRFRSAVSAGPFRVTAPNNNLAVWHVGEYQTVTWDVANTDIAPVNCKKVNIKLSINGGFTYTITLAEGVPNIGRACVLVPTNVSSLARVRIEAADNIFFDISNANFKIQQPSVPSFSLCTPSLKEIACLPSTYSAVINTSTTAGFADIVTLSATGLPNGVTAEFSPNPVAAGSPSTLTINFPANTPESTFDVGVQGASGALSSSATITLTTVNNNFSSIAPTAPANGASGVNTQPLLQWSTAVDANVYEVELATNPSFAPNTIVTSNYNTTLGSFQVTTALSEGQVYFWRIRPKNECGTGNWSETQVFVVGLLSCVELSANDLPKNITANGTPTIESKITLLSGGQISDVNVQRVQGFHEYFRDLEVHLISPTGTDVMLWKDRCGAYNGNFSVSFDDGAGSSFTCPPSTTNAEIKPAGLLSSFNGENATGVWTLRVKDNTQSSGGSISAFELEICANESTSPPLITVNNLLQPSPGGNAGIDANFLKAEDSNNTPAQLTFTLTSIPQHGLLQNFGGDLQVGSQFTQADIDNGGLRYFDFGLNAGMDDFRFVVADGEGGMAMGVFQISPLVGTKDLLNGLVFDFAPNPADEMLRLTLNEPLTADALVSMYNAAGQLVHSWSLASGNTYLPMQVSDLPEGVYAVSIENEAVKGVKKVVIR